MVLGGVWTLFWTLSWYLYHHNVPYIQVSVYNVYNSLYTINRKQKKTKWKYHLETQRTYFTLTIRMFQSYCFVLKWNLSKLIYRAEFFQFCKKLFCSRKLIIGFFFLLLPVIILMVQDFIISLRKKEGTILWSLLCYGSHSI